MNPRGCIANYRAWSEQERATLRERYLKVPVAELAATLGRSVNSVTHEAQDLGLCRSVKWTPAADARLREMWGDEALGTIALKLNRTRVAVHRRAQDIGLKTFAPDGYESVKSASKRTGFDQKTLRRILEWAALNGITDPRQPVERLPWAPRTGKKWRRHIVESFEVDGAVTAWMGAETIHAAAVARGINDSAIKRALRKFGGELPPKLPGDYRRPYRLPSSVIDAALAKKAAARARAGAERLAA